MRSPGKLLGSSLAACSSLRFARDRDGRPPGQRLVLGSVTLRAVLALGVVVAGYTALHEHFASFDAAVARTVLGGLGFETSSAGPGTLTVRAGDQFGVYAIVTGACSSAAGALGIAAVSLVLLPGRLWRRIGGGALAGVVFVGFNVARICSIVLVGWWLATASRPALLVTLFVPALACVWVVLLPRRKILTRVAALLAAGLFGVLLFDVSSGYDYSIGMVTYHALAGPVLTFGTLAAAILLLWRVIVGPDVTSRRPSLP